MNDFNYALKLDPENSHLYYNRGNLFFMLKDYENAVKDYSAGDHFAVSACWGGGGVEGEFIATILIFWGSFLELVLLEIVPKLY